MKILLAAHIVAVALVTGGCSGPEVEPGRGGTGEPAVGAHVALAPWAYPVNPPAPVSNPGGGAGGGSGATGGGAPGAGGGAAPAQNAPLLTVPGSTQTFTRAQLRNLFDVADWRPDLHPPMPEVVHIGRRPGVMACGYCHQPNGQGRPENASLAGLPVEYIVQQITDYRDDLRVSSEPRMGPPRTMVNVAKAATDEEIRAAAEYFSSLQPVRWIRVVEAATVPSPVIEGGMFLPAEDGSTEPIGRRILEMPEDPARTMLRDPASGFVAYVPPGSVARGETLVRTGDGGRTTQCAVCHGEDLRGLGPVPPLAGRSPSQMARQLNDFRTGSRAGSWSGLMSPVVAQLTPDDVIAITAYLANLDP